MAIITLSGLSHTGRRELSESLSRKTGWPVLSRENLLDQAAEAGIKVGRLEVSLIKSGIMSEKLAREKDLYLAFVTSVLCEKAKEGNLIYRGRAGHLLLPGVGHKLRIGLTSPRGSRIFKAAGELNMNPDRAEGYLDSLDEDINKWIHFAYQTDGMSPDNFDLFINLEKMGLENAVNMVCNVAESKEFSPKPAGEKLLDDLYLAAQAKLKLAMDKRTTDADLSIHCSDKILTVTYPPRQESVSEEIAGVLQDLNECREVRCTMADTSILWVQEEFSPDSVNFSQLMEVANRWGAAVELLRVVPPEGMEDIPVSPAKSNGNGHDQVEGFQAYNGGVEDDEPVEACEDGGLECTQEQLVLMGRSAGRQTICGGQEKIVETLKSGSRYTLVVIGDMFLSKGQSTRTRQTRELAMAIRDRLKVPVITADELKSRFLFGKKQAIQMVAFLLITALIYFTVFEHQNSVLDFMGGELHKHWKWVTSVAVFIFVPIIAYIYGSFMGLVLKLAKMD